MKEYPIGAIIIDSYRRYVVKPTILCTPCAFWNTSEGGCTCNHVVFGHCSETLRKDKASVVFIDLGEEPTPLQSAPNQP